jgi:hypothetical protein
LAVAAQRFLLLGRKPLLRENLSGPGDIVGNLRLEFLDRGKVPFVAEPLYKEGFDLLIV